MTKIALLIGINYTGTDSQLNGCINDIYNVKENLINHFGYSESNITIITDNTDSKPTAMNILHSIAKVVIQAYNQQANEIWIHYSGHGTSIIDRSGDEKDNRDEAIVPIDYQTNGVISDDYLHYYFTYLPSNCKCICFFDCCHSGTILDLKYNHQPNQLNSIDNNKSSINSNILMFSGCLDSQTSADYYNDSAKKWQGAMTNALLHCLKESNYCITCKDLLFEMQKYLSDNNFTQIPKLSTSKPLSNISIFCANSELQPFIYSS